MFRNSMYLLIFLLAGCSGPGPRAPVQAPPAPATARAEHTEALLQTLFALGLDYRSGGRSPVTGFDCSGLVAHVYREAWGIQLPPDTRGQSKAGVPVSLAELVPGDLVFYD